MNTVERSLNHRIRRRIVRTLRVSKQRTADLLKAIALGCYRMWYPIDEFFYRRPNPMLSKKWEAETPEALKAHVAELRQDGITVLPAFYSGERLRQFQDAFTEMMAGIEKRPPSAEILTPDRSYYRNARRAKFSAEGYDPEIGTSRCGDPFKHNPIFWEFVLDDIVLNILARYFGKVFTVNQMGASRYYPTDKRDFGSWQWHHDAWGRKVNVMLLLTDVGENDQYMTYMKGSHNLVHSLTKLRKSRYRDEEVQNLPGCEPFKCLGKAGTVLIFDSNGFHRGNRSMGAIREHLLPNYTAGRYLWEMTMPQSTFASLNDLQGMVVRANPHIQIS